MDDQTACEVKGSKLCQEAAAPYPMSHRIIDEDRPKKNEYSKSRKFHPLGKRACNERRRNNGKHTLKCNKYEFGDRPDCHFAINT